MAAVTAVPVETPRDVDKTPPIIHRYSGIGAPRPGDVALCGWRKKCTSGPVRTGTTCVVCRDLIEAGL